MNSPLFYYMYFVLAKRKMFEHKRKAHYNEFMAVKLARQLMNSDDEDEEGGADDADDHKVQATAVKAASEIVEGML